MSDKTKTVLANTNPLLWLAAALAVVLVIGALAVVVPLALAQWLRRELTSNPQARRRTETAQAPPVIQTGLQVGHQRDTRIPECGQCGIGTEDQVCPACHAEMPRNKGFVPPEAPDALTPLGMDHQRDTAPPVFGVEVPQPATRRRPKAPAAAQLSVENLTRATTKRRAGKGQATKKK